MIRLKEVRHVLIYTLFLNMAVALAKIIYGYKINSISMFSDGFHSFFDGTSNVIGLIGIWIASQPPDESHPYGHRKFETLS
ncbi:MAG TPA: cation transporter, partial [Thermodesulfovibrionia bacterium]|nr:cation transporter [Thermodesulfovibrionia bacterium]